MTRLLLLGIVLLGLPGVANADDEFPKGMQGFWGDSRETCRTLNSDGPAYIGVDNLWLKIMKTDVLGTTQGRFLQAEKPMMVNMKPAKYSIPIQAISDAPQLFDLTVSLDGKLFETIVDARSSSIYIRC